MKGKAIIILCCVLAYMVGWMAVPQIMQPIEKSCCTKATEKAGEHHCPKESKENRKCTDCGISYPICYVMIMPATGPEGITVVVSSRSYPEYYSTYLYRFHSDTWKPPNEV